MPLHAVSQQRGSGWENRLLFGRRRFRTWTFWGTDLVLFTSRSVLSIDGGILSNWSPKSETKGLLVTNHKRHQGTGFCDDRPTLSLSITVE